MEQIIEAARAVFSAKKTIYTNEVLTRRELRKLEAKGMVECMQTTGKPIRLIWQAKEKLWIK